MGHSTAFAYPAGELSALALAGHRRKTRRFGRVLLLLLVLAPFVLAFAPWQQNLPGDGRVIEFNPVDRPMPLQARTDGVILQWHVREGQLVQAGDPIVDLADNDPRLLERLQEQLTAAEQKRTASAQKRDQYELQIVEAEAARAAAMQLAQDDVAAAEQAVVVAEQAVTVARANVRFREFSATMWQGLVTDRIGAGFELESARQQLDIANAELGAREAAVLGAQAQLRARQSARTRVERDEQVKIQTVRANRDGAAGEFAEAESSVLRAQRDLERQRQQRLIAPVAGFVQRLFANGQGGGFVKQSTTLALLVPSTKQLAVELFVDGNDVTFVEVGRHVRLQFEGWPAIQWVGWPSAAIGTFGGRVEFVDRYDDGTGTFRVMVLPDERPFREPEGPWVEWLRGWITFDKVNGSQNPHAWPGDPWLRQGVRARGWVVLDEVSLGFEVWRQLNGFPPQLPPPPKAIGDGPKGDDGKSGDDKGGGK
jgi:multidrug efflux pump subunit AcrA (membrane-fusion protein)